MANNPYNQYGQLRQLPYNITSLLMENDDIWKLLKYNTSDALSKANLSNVEKGQLIYSGQTDSTPYRLFLQAFSDDTFTEVQTHLNIFIGGIRPQNYVLSTVDVYIEILSHNKIITLDDYENRNLVMLEQITKTLNGQEIGGIGKLSFDYDKSSSNRATFTYFNKAYQGYRMAMSVFTA